jgi:hypothetical protein
LGKHGGHKAPTLNGETGDSLRTFVQEHPLSTLETMRGFLSSVCGVNVCVNTITNWLDGQLLTLKAVRDVPAERNSTATKERRFYFAKWMLESLASQKCVYIDECGFNIWTKRTYGRSVKGSRCFRVMDYQRGKNMSLCMAIGECGIIHHQIIVGAFDREKYTVFLEELSEIVGGNETHFVMDNCRIHHGIALNKEEHSLVYLPPYSPFLNPIEAAFSVLKTEIKSKLSSLDNPMPFTYPERRAVLQQVICSSLHVVTAPKCRSFYHHSSSFYPKCIQKENIFGD